MFIIPGIGSHRSTTNAVKLAESAWQRGYSAVIVSSPFNPEFILTGLSATYPGYTPSDAEDLYRTLGEIRANIEANHPGKVTSSSLMGYSLGGIATLFISQIERNAIGPGRAPLRACRRDQSRGEPRVRVGTLRQLLRRAARMARGASAATGRPRP